MIIVEGEHMKDKKNESLTWIREHKKELIAIGISVGVVVSLILCAKNTETIEAFISELKDRTMDSRKRAIRLANEKPGELLTHAVHEEEFLCDINVSTYCRRLPVGQKASLKKLAEAAELGIDLEGGKTIVDGYSYPKSKKVA